MKKKAYARRSLDSSSSRSFSLILLLISLQFWNGVWKYMRMIMVEPIPFCSKIQSFWHYLELKMVNITQEPNNREGKNEQHGGRGRGSHHGPTVASSTARPWWLLPRLLLLFSNAMSPVLFGTILSCWVLLAFFHAFSIHKVSTIIHLPYTWAH